MRILPLGLDGDHPEWRCVQTSDALPCDTCEQLAYAFWVKGLVQYDPHFDRLGDTQLCLSCFAEDGTAVISERQWQEIRRLNDHQIQGYVHLRHSYIRHEEALRIVRIHETQNGLASREDVKRGERR
ncbi:MAG TPA: hypothetical protein VHQ98_06640 [Gaiellaceae bacterium]|jgi:hypothetical protein|nr:hypothetical protein [Gaiellaceae bacterium]